MHHFHLILFRLVLQMHCLSVATRIIGMGKEGGEGGG